MGIMAYIEFFNKCIQVVTQGDCGEHCPDSLFIITHFSVQQIPLYSITNLFQCIVVLCNFYAFVCVLHVWFLNHIMNRWKTIDYG
jgi:hypothetical protein